MANAILELTNHCWNKKIYDSYMNTHSGHAGKGLIAETVVWITALVISILGLTNVITMPPAAAYGILALPCTMFALFIPALIKMTCGTSSGKYHGYKH